MKNISIIPFFLMCAAPLPTHAIITYGQSNSDAAVNYDSTDNAALTSVVAIDSGSAVYVGNGWFLTANHVSINSSSTILQNGNSASVSYVDNTLKSNLGVDLKLFYISCAGGSLITSNGITNVDSSYMMFWTKFPNGYFNNCNTPTSWSVFRRKKIKESAQVVSLAEHWITFHYEKPSNLQGQYAPKNRNGAQVNSFSLTTTPTVWEHINKINNGELVLLEDEKIDPQLFHGLYKKTATYVPAK